MDYLELMDYNLIFFSLILLFKYFYFNKSFLQVKNNKFKRVTFFFTLESVVYFHFLKSILILNNFDFQYSNYLLLGISLSLALFGIKYLTIYSINLIINYFNLRRYNLFLKSSLDKSLEEIDKLGNNGLDFEEYNAKLFRSMGLWAKTTTDLRKEGNLPTEIQKSSGTGEQGVDVIVYLNKSEKLGNDYYDALLIQCKQYSGTVGNSAVQEIVGALKMYSSFYNKKFKPVVITNNYFTPHAKILAESNDVKLIDRDELPNLIRESCSTIKELKKIC